MDRYADRRSLDRDRYAPAGDSYVPSGNRNAPTRSRSPVGYRRRSRSPPPRQGDSWRGRPRSPLGRADVYSRGARPRSPRQDHPTSDYRFDQDTGAPRERSPATLKRGLSPSGRSGRSPPLLKGERTGSPLRDFTRTRSPSRRLHSPPRDSRVSYRPRSRSPRRDDRVDPQATKSWRRRSPSPREGSERNSLATSRRSSPRAYDRGQPEPVSHEQGLRRGPPSSSYRSPRPRSPPPPRARSPYRDERAFESRSRPINGDTYSGSDAPIAPSHNRIPTGPARFVASPPSLTTPVSMSAHNRPDSASGYAGPPPGGRGGYRGRGGAPPSRDYTQSLSRQPSGGWPSGAASYGGRGGPSPREGHPPREPYGAPPSRRQDYSGPPSFRGSGNSTSTTYPRTQRFATHLSDLPSAKPGGEKLPPVHDPAKAEKLEEEAARLRKMIDEKEAQKRQGLREWERMERDATTNALKSELAEEHLRTLNGESGEGTTAAF